MDLKNIDENYKKSKGTEQKINIVKNRIKALEPQISTLAREIRRLELEKQFATEDNDKTNLDRINAELEQKKDEKAKFETQLASSKKFITKSMLAVNEQVNALANDSKFNDYVNEVIGKKFSRKILAIENETNNLVFTNMQLENVKKVAQKDPYVKNTLRGIETASKIINASKEPKTPEEQANLDMAKRKLEARRKDLKTYFKNTISDEVINSLTSLSDIDYQLKNNNRQLKGFNKQITNYETALNEIGYISPRNNNINNFEFSNDNNHENSDDSYNFNFIPKNQENDDRNSNLPEEQPKWYQFIKRFKIWNNRRKENKAVKEISNDVVSEESKENKENLISSKENSDFRTAMKYDVVKDYISKKETDLLKQAKQKQHFKDIKNEEER